MKPNNIKKKKQQPAFLDQLKMQYGPDFLRKINPLYIKKNALKIFKDIASGNFNFEEHSQYFSEAAFTYNLLCAAQDNMNYNWYCYVGLSSNPSLTNNPQAVSISKELYETYCAYNTLCAHLNNILIAIQYSNFVQIPILLKNLSFDISKYKYKFNGYYITIERERDRSYNKIERRQIHNGEAGSNIPERQI